MKDSVICLRISSMLRAKLMGYSVSEEILSAVIENILYQRLEGKEGETAGKRSADFPGGLFSHPPWCRARMVLLQRLSGMSL